MTISMTKLNGFSFNASREDDGARLLLETMTEHELRHTVETLRQLLRDYKALVPSTRDGEVRWQEGWVDHDEANGRTLDELKDLLYQAESRLKQLVGMSDVYAAVTLATALVDAMERIDARQVAFREHLTTLLDERGHDPQIASHVLELLQAHLELRDDAFLGIRQLLERARSPIIVPVGGVPELLQ